MIRFRDVTVLKGGRPALSAFSADFPSRGFVSVLGPSGAGKSTLLRSLAGLDPLAAGRIEADGRTLDASVPPHARGLSMVFQDLALWPHLTVEGNLLLALSGRSDAAVRAGEAAARWGLRGMETRLPHTLSGGERQRLAFARAWAPGKPLLLLDEPASALDRPARESLLSELARLRKEEGFGVVYVTHQQDEALRLSDLILVLMEGRLAQAGTREDLLDRPASPQVAGFLGGIR